MPNLKVHDSITLERLLDACNRRETTLDNPGFCIKCGEEQEGTEPDARKYDCEACETATVYGAEELLLMIM